jgi:hypothetical protein
MKKNITAKIFATLALIWIVFSIIGTGILFLYETKFSPTAPQPTFEDYLKNNPLPIDPKLASWSTLTWVTLPVNTTNQ